MSAARGCSPTARMRRPIGVLKSTTQVATIVRNASQIIRLSWPSTGPMKYQSSRKPRWTSGMLGDVRRRALAAVDVDEEVAGDPEREEVDRRPADDLVGAQVDREEGVDEREQRRRRAAAQSRPSAQESSLSAPRMPKNAPDSIIPSRPMFTTPLRSEKMPPIAAKASGVA